MLQHNTLTPNLSHHVPLRVRRASVVTSSSKLYRFFSPFSLANIFNSKIGIGFFV